MNKEFQTIGLYDHNIVSYKKIREALNKDDVVAIVHATGTGKSYNALQLSYDNKDKKILYIVPSNGIIEHIQNIISSNTNLDINRDFSNLEFRTYQSFINMSTDEIKALKTDMLILDEFHHLGAPVWGARINSIIETHPNIKIFGMTAYTVRDRGTPYERDMANPETNELFSNKIVSRYDLCDAMLDGVLPKPIYKTAYVNLLSTQEQLEEKVKQLNATSEEYQEYMKILIDTKKRIQEAPKMSDIMKRNIKKNGKYIYFCPPNSEEGVNDIGTIINEVKLWFHDMGLTEDDFVIYETTSKMGIEGKQNREAFYNDKTVDGQIVTNKLRIMFAINQYNEGIHAPNVDGVILGRGTTSDIVYFEQLGRALSIRGLTKEQCEEYEKLPIVELIKVCQNKDIPIPEGISKAELIEKLLAPVVLDLTNNYEFISELENNLKDRLKERRDSKSENSREIKISSPLFDVELLNKDLYELLKYVNDRLTMTWEDKYELAKKYYEYHGDLMIPSNFITTNGYEYDENGVKLGNWISTQRNKLSSLSEDQKQLLKNIGFVENVLEYQWQSNYNLAKKYYEHHGDLMIPSIFITTNGYEYDANGIALGRWLIKQRNNLSSLSEERKQLLKNIGFVEDVLEYQWQSNYNLAKKYYEHHGDLMISVNFITANGYEYDENGVKLGKWISTQRVKVSSFPEERKQLLKNIGFIENNHEYKWQSNYELAKKYYEHHGDLMIPVNFVTTNGYEYDENGVKLGKWMNAQRARIIELSEERKQLLKNIGFVEDVFEYQWQSNYELAKKYYEHHGDLMISQDFITQNGYEYDKNGVKLGIWINAQRAKIIELSEERKQLLKNIGFVEDVFEFQWQNNYELAKKYYEHHDDLMIPSNFITTNGYEYDKNGVKLGSWISAQRSRISKLSEDKKMLLENIGMVWNINKNTIQIKELCESKGINYDTNIIVLSHISIQELTSKILFLQEKSISVVDNEGKLHEIFSMSNPNMIEKYGVNLEEIITIYNAKKAEKRGK